MSGREARGGAPSATRYVLTWAALMGLLLLTLGSAYIHMGTFNVVANLAISVAKTVLVMTVFMHLVESRPVVRLAAMAGFFWLGLLLLLSLGDYLTR